MTTSTSPATAPPPVASTVSRELQPLPPAAKPPATLPGFKVALPGFEQFPAVPAPHGLANRP